MKRAAVPSILVAVVLLALGVIAEAQQSRKSPRIGVLSGGSGSANTGRREAFRQDLRELGYVEVKNIIVKWRWADGKIANLPRARGRVSASHGRGHRHGGAQVTRVVKEATSTIPIVMAFDNDPVGSGHIASLARPGENITGLSTLSPELSGKQLELLKEVVPGLWSNDVTHHETITTHAGFRFIFTTGTAVLP